MSNIFAIFKREVYSYFVTPMAYILSSVFLTISGYFFYNILLAFNEICRRFAGIESMHEKLNMGEMIIRPLVMNIGIVLLLIIPLMTMRLYSEENNSGTIELLFTSPVTTMDIIMGKFLAASFVFTSMLSITLVYPGILSLFGNLEKGVVFSAFLGIWLLGLSFISLGNFASTLTNNQMIAAILGFGSFLLLWMLSWAVNILEGGMAKAVNYISIVPHLENMAKGIIDSRDIVYFITMIVLGLFLTKQSLDSMKWRM